ncbi:MAG: hypothetical protein DHS20C02_02570 [Micavibrio sp.]|nr:MAG: hypothetical protein DHS20C02_02570 [Micavibrio sp.]
MRRRNTKFLNSLRFPMMVAACGLAMSAPAYAVDGYDAEQSLIKDGKFYANVRYRFEHVEQDGFTKDADASTIRTRFGFQTGTFEGFQGQIEAEAVGYLGDDNFNNTINGNTTFPVVADPNGVEINQAWISWAGLPDTKIKAGRQRVNIDNQRFVGAVGWRQNEQTFDAAFIENSSIPNLDLQYGYIHNVNRLFGDDHPLGDLKSENHILHAAYTVADWLKVAGYGYFLDFDLPAASGLSNETYGVRLTGSHPFNDVKFAYEAEYAMQEDHGNNTASYDVDYFHVSPSVSWGGLTVAAGFESLEGNGTNAFATPLATLHKFNGWADKFLATPVMGLEDSYVKVVYKVDGVHEWLDGTKFVGVYHDFDSEQGSMDYGDELDLQVSRKLPHPDFLKGASIALKYADYDADGLFTDTKKYWVSLGVDF